MEMSKEVGPGLGLGPGSVVLVAHGGAGEIPDSRVEPKLAGLRRAIRAGFVRLLEEDAGSVAAETQNENTSSTSSSPAENVAVKAVVAAIKVLEEEEAFNAGFGSVLNREGRVEMDAAVMDGRNLGYGAVAAIENVLYPTAVAERVMTDTPHCFLAGRGANQFATECCPPEDVRPIDNEKLISKCAKSALKQSQEHNSNVTNEIGQDDFDDDGQRGTVGAVALDRHGNLAAATSTGGMTGQMAGRVGDSPIIGAGLYADNEAGAVSTTGTGETLLRSLLAKRIVDLMAKSGNNSNESASQNIKQTLDEMTARLGGDGGAISVTQDGSVGIEWNSRRMAWAYAVWQGKEADGEIVIHSGCNRGKDYAEDL